MPSTPVKRERFRILDELGIDRVVELYVDEVRTVRGLVGRLFTSHTKDGQPGFAEFYAWLQERGHEAAWRDALRLRGRMAADEAVDLACETDENTVRSAKLKSDVLRWQASKLSPSEFGDRQTLDIGPSESFGASWLAALHAVDGERRRKAIAAEAGQEG